jgi:hypothetical protein
MRHRGAGHRKTSSGWNQRDAGNAAPSTRACIANGGGRPSSCIFGLFPGRILFPFVREAPVGQRSGIRSEHRLEGVHRQVKQRDPGPFAKGGHVNHGLPIGWANLGSIGGILGEGEASKWVVGRRGPHWQSAQASQSRQQTRKATQKAWPASGPAPSRPVEASHGGSSEGETGQPGRASSFGLRRPAKKSASRGGRDGRLYRKAE